MSQPPSAPRDVDAPGAARPGTWGAPAGSDDPTEQFGPPGQREHTRRLDQPGAQGSPSPYGQAPYGQAPYGQAPYGQAPYGQPPYGQPPYGQPWAPPGAPPGKNRNLTTALVIAAVVVLAAAGVALWLLMGRGGDSVTSTSLPPATVTPDGLGADPVLDAYALDCYEGSMEACDDLFFEAQAGSLYESYGDTCAGRQPPGTNVFCTVSFPSQ